MAAQEHKFRYLLKPGNDFRFVANFRKVGLISLFLCLASIAALFINKEVRGSHLNWTIDFKGGTEVIYALRDAAAPAGETRYVRADSGKVRAALQKAGAAGFDVSERSWTEEVGGRDVTVRGILVRTPRFGATTPQQQQQALTAFQEKFADRELDRVQWSGDRLHVRSRKAIAEAEAADLWTAAGLEAKPWDESAALYTQPDEGTGEYNMTFSMHGLDRQYERVLEAELGGIDAVVVQTSQVSAKAGAELRNDGIKSLFYAMLLIVIYLAVRFDIRYAPGAVVATLHDAIMVIGVFAVAWVDVSLTSVAALLTVIGFSVNDTVIIFDRIRENVEKLKDKKLERIVDISLNETLVRSLLTSVTLFVVTLMMNVFGEGLVRNFAFAMNAGIVVGVYSSLFLAPPVFLWVANRWYSGPAPARAPSIGGGRERSGRGRTSDPAARVRPCSRCAPSTTARWRAWPAASRSATRPPAAWWRAATTRSSAPAPSSTRASASCGAPRARPAWPGSPPGRRRSCAASGSRSSATTTSTASPPARSSPASCAAAAATSWPGSPAATRATASPRSPPRSCWPPTPGW